MKAKPITWKKGFNDTLNGWVDDAWCFTIVLDGSGSMVILNGLFINLFNKGYLKKRVRANDPDGAKAKRSIAQAYENFVGDFLKKFTINLVD